MSYKTNTDEELMIRYQAGDSSAFDELYRRYSRRVYGYFEKRLSTQQSADELFQKTFLKLHKSRASYEEGWSFAPWLFTIARNNLIDHFRKVGRTPQWESYEESAPHQGLDRSSEIPWEALSDEERGLIERRFELDQSYEEMSEALGKSPQSLRKALSRALGKMRRETKK